MYSRQKTVFTISFSGRGLLRGWWLPPLSSGRDIDNHSKSQSQLGWSGGPPCPHQYFLIEIHLEWTGFKLPERFKDGFPSGLSWFSLEGGGWLVGELDQEGSYTGEAAYLYPDLSTAIVGVFEDGRLVRGREARLAGLECEMGLLRPRWSSCCIFLNQINSHSHWRWSRWRGKDEFCHLPPTSSSLPGKPLVRDPLDARYTSVQSSSIHGAGEGLFAKKDVEAYTIVSVYSGLTMSKDQYMAEATLSQSKDSSNLATPNAIGLEPNQVTKKRAPNCLWERNTTSMSSLWLDSGHSSPRGVQRVQWSQGKPRTATKLSLCLFRDTQIWPQYGCWDRDQGTCRKFTFLLKS